jgi:tetratricopeptide (TPR) repeat protein
VASPLLAGFSFTNVIVIIVSGTGHFLLPGEAIISWTIASIAFVFAVQFAKWVARKKVNYERTVLFYHVGVVTFLLGFGFALAPQPSTGAYFFRWIAAGGAFAVCVIEAGVYVNRELRDRNLRRFEKALVICRETGDRDGEAQTLNNLGNAYRKLRRFEEAIGCLKDSLVISRETSDRYGEGRTLSNLGDVYQSLRQPDRAAACWRDAAAAVREAGYQEEAARLEQQAASAGSRRRRWRRGN